jgi:TonB family protein
MRRVSAVFLLVFFATGISKVSLAQGTAAPGAPSQQDLGKNAVDYIAGRFAIDAANLVPETQKPLTGAGNWSVAKNPPPVCANIQFPCILLSYRQAGTNVLCQWTVLLKSNSEDRILLDLNEDAARYFTKRIYGNGDLKTGFNEISGGKLISSAQPIYPQSAKIARIQGSVKLLARIDETGHVSDIKMISGPERLRASSIDAVKQWRYEPLKIGSVPISIRTVITVHYSFS